MLNEDQLEGKGRYGLFRTTITTTTSTNTTITVTTTSTTSTTTIKLSVYDIVMLSRWQPCRLTCRGCPSSTVIHIKTPAHTPAVSLTTHAP